MAWLPVAFVPAIISWTGLPVVMLLGSTPSLPEAAVAVAKLRGFRGGYSYSPSLPRSAAGASGANLRAAVKATQVLLIVAGGWLVNLGSAAAIFTALSPPSPPSPTSSAGSCERGAGAAASSPSWRPEQTVVASAATGFFGPRLVRRLAAWTVASGALSMASGAAARGERYWSCALEKLGMPLSSIEQELGFHALHIAGIFSALLSIGLATMLGFAAGRLAVSPGRMFRFSLPAWVAVLLPLATSAAASMAIEWLLHFYVFCLTDDCLEYR